MGGGSLWLWSDFGNLGVLWGLWGLWVLSSGGALEGSGTLRGLRGTLGCLGAEFLVGALRLGGLFTFRGLSLC